jgi:hypothetical protein
MRRFLSWLFRRPNPELVPYRNFATGKTVLIPKSELCPGVVLIQIKGEERPVYVDAAQLKQGHFQHPPFEGEVRAAIQSLVNELADVFARSYEEWEDGFRRDQTPEREIAGWVHLAAILRVMTERFAFSPAEKKECFRVLVACFTGARETVLDRSDPKLLSDAQINQAVQYFYEGGYS